MVWEGGDTQEEVWGEDEAGLGVGGQEGVKRKGEGVFQ